MGYRIIGHEIGYPSTHIVSKLTDFLLTYSGYFRLFCHILIRAKGRRRQEMTQLNIEKALEIREVDIKYMAIFKELLNDFYTADDESDGRVRGQIAEFIVSKLGPGSFKKCPSTSVKQKCQVKDEENNIVGGLNDFDVGFYKNNDCSIQLIAELLECKVDLNNFLFKEPSKPENLEIGKEAAAKLAYMQNVKDSLACTSFSQIAFATVRYDISSSEKLLAKHGYSGIPIYDLNYLTSLLRVS